MAGGGGQRDGRRTGGRYPKSHFSEVERMKSGRMAGWGLALTEREGLGFGLCGDSRSDSKR